MKETEKDENVFMFSFARKYSAGCTGHPDIREHQQMAEELVPFFREIKNW